MTADKQNAPEDVIPREISVLLERQATLRGWIGKLDELRGTVRPEVFEKVRGDYESRLRRKEAQLIEHRPGMENALEERRRQVQALESERDDRAAQLEEAELRFAVGEFSENEYGKQKTAHEEQLEKLDGQLEAGRAGQQNLEKVVTELASLSAVSSKPVGRSEKRPLIPTPSRIRTPERASRGSASAGGGRSARAAEQGERDETRASSAGVEESGSWLKSVRSKRESAPAAKVEARTVEPPAAAEASQEKLQEQAELVEQVEANESPPVKSAGQAAKEAVEEAAQAAGGSETGGETQTSPEPAEAKTEKTEEKEPDYLDDLAFLESLSLDDTEKFDAVSAMLEEETEADDRGSKKSES